MEEITFTSEWVSERELLQSNFLPFKRTALNEAIKAKKFPAPLRPANSRMKKWHVSQLVTWKQNLLLEA